MPEQDQQLPGKPISLWLDTTPATDYPPLRSGLSVDVAVVGAGIAGLTTAVLLQAAGKTVAVIEAGRIVHDVTGHTTAKLTALHTLIYDHLLRSFGEAKARAYGQAQQAAIEQVAELVREKGIDCDFTRADAWTFAESEAEAAQIEAEVKAARQLGLPADAAQPPLPFPVAAAVRFTGQARFHPRKYLLALAADFAARGGHIFENTRAVEATQDEPCLLLTDRGSLLAHDIVVASHFPFNDKASFASRLLPQRAYVLAARLSGPVPAGLFIDTAESFSLRPQPWHDGELALITGEGHRVGEAADTRACYQRLELAARNRLPVRAVEYRWSTQDNATPDRVPFIGRYTPRAKHLYVAAGFGGWGMSNGTVAGMLLRDLILGRDNPWAEVFDPKRLNLASVPDLFRQNAKVAAHFVADRVGHPATDLPAPGEGRVVTGAHGNVAQYCDAAGQLHERSAVCSHLGCIVHWNAAEKTWDCPCHGSRFGIDGQVVHGPAIHPLRPA